VKSADPFELQHLERPRRTTRPAPRTRVDELPADVGGRAWRRHVGHSAARPHALSGWMNVSPPHAPTLVAGNNAALIGERAATRGRGAMERGRPHAAPGGYRYR